MLVVLAGCAAPNVVEPVGGVDFPVESTYLTTEPGTFGEDDLVTVVLSSLPGACELERSFREAAQNTESAAGLADAWASAYPASFTEVELVARVLGGTWPPKGALWSGLAWDELPEQNNVIFSVYTAHEELRDTAYFSGDAPDSDYERVFTSNGGLVKWGKAEPGVRLSGRFNSDLVDGEGSFVGTSEVRFDAAICGF